MKKYIKWIFLVVLIILVFIVKGMIDKKTIDYETILNDSFTSFYISSSKEDLKPAMELLNKYKNDENLRTKIQNYAFTIVGSWYKYLDEKYVCDRNNLNSCKVQLEEFKRLNNKLNDLYDYKTKNGYALLLPSAYSNLSSEGEKKITGLEKVIASPSAKNPKDSEEIRLEKCNKAIECNNCRDGLCKCYYMDGKNREEITCKDKNNTQ